MGDTRQLQQASIVREKKIASLESNSQQSEALLASTRDHGTVPDEEVGADAGSERGGDAEAS